MLRAQEIHNGRVQFGSDLIGPAALLPEVAGGEEVDVEGLLGVGAWRGADAFCRSFEVVDGVLDFLFDCFGF